MLLTTHVSVLLATVEGTVALTLMTVQEWSVQETALALMVLIHSHVFATMALREKTVLVGVHDSVLGYKLYYKHLYLSKSERLSAI